MFGTPRNTNAIPIVTVIAVAFIVLYALMALYVMQVAVRCGPACSVLMGAVHP